MSRRRPFLVPAAVAALLYLAVLVVLALAARDGGASPTLLELDAAAPLAGVNGQDFATTLTGRGFDDQTRVSLALDAVNGDAIVATMETWANLHDVTVAGDWAYLANSYRGFQVADISAPLRPRIVGSLATRKAWAVAVQGTTAYLADAKDGLLVIDVTDPASPRLLAKVEIPGIALDVAVQGNTAYLAAGPGGLQVLDIASQDEPRVVDAYAAAGPVWDFVLSDGLGFLATSTGVWALDLADPHRPRALASLGPPGRVSSLAAVDRQVFFVDSDRCFKVVDVRDPLQPVLVSALPVSGGFSRVTVAGNRAYLSSSFGGVMAIAIDDPRNPRILAQVVESGAMQLAVAGNLGFVASSSRGLRVLDLEVLQPLQALGALATDGHAWSVTKVGDIACLADGHGGLKVVDLSDPTQPGLLSAVSVAGEVTQVVVQGEVAYLAAGASGLQILDIGDPLRPRLVGSVPTSGTVYDLSIEGDTALLLERPPAVASANGEEPGKRVRVVDIADPAAPRLVGSVEAPKEVRRVCLAGGKGYLAGGGRGLLVLDLGDREQPEVISSATLPWPEQAFAWARAVQVLGETAYLANGMAGLQVIDLADPHSPEIVSNLGSVGYLKNINVSGGRAYLHHRDGLQVVDVRDPRRPTVVGSLPLPRAAEGVMIADGKALVAAGKSGLMVFPLPVEGEVVAAGPEQLEVTFPGPELPGRYLLTIHGRGGSAQLPEPIVFSAP